MGNNISNQNTTENNSCLICWEIIDDIQQLSKCVRCNIVMHNICEELYRLEKKYCKCPHCCRIGTIGYMKMKI